MTNDAVSAARKALIDTIISMYHTTRIAGTPAADHILSKQIVRDAFDRLSAIAPGGDTTAGKSGEDARSQHADARLRALEEAASLVEKRVRSCNHGERVFAWEHGMNIAAAIRALALGAGER